MPQVVELSKPRITQSDARVQLDLRYTITVSSIAAAGNADVKYYVYRDRALKGEEYPALVRVWDNDVDDIYDTL